MKVRLLLSTVLFLSHLAYAQTSPAYAEVADTLNVTPSSIVVLAFPGSSGFTVTSNVSWTAASNQPWLTVSVFSGTNNGTINVSYTANPGSTTRTATITVTGGSITRTVTVIQQGQAPNGCYNGSEPANDSPATAPAIPLSTEIESQIGAPGDFDYWKFTLTSSQHVTIFMRSPVGNYDLTLMNAAGFTLGMSTNFGTQSEVISGMLSAGTYYALVTSSLGYSTSLCYKLEVTPNAPTILTVDPWLKYVGPGAGNTSFTVTSNANWTVTDDQPWVNIFPNSWSGNGEFTASFASNPGSQARAATITLSSGPQHVQKITLIQNGANPPDCANDYEPTNNSHPTAPTIPFNTDVYSRLGPGWDQDHWRFTLTEPTAVTVRMSNLAADYSMDLFNLSTGAGYANGNASGLADEVVEEVLGPGNYSVYIYKGSAGAATTSCYKLRVSALSLGVCANGDEPANNSVATAPFRPLNSFTLSQIASPTDQDFWKFEVDTPGQRRIGLLGLPADYDMQIINSDGAIIASNTQTGTHGFGFNTTFNPGTYYVRIFGKNGASTLR